MKLAAKLLCYHCIKQKKHGGNNVLRKLLPWRRSLTVFSFHAVVPDPLPVVDFCFTPLQTFCRQLEAITSNYRIVTVAEAIEAIAAGTLPERAAAITFDDGYRNTWDVALPELRRKGVPACVFACTGPILGGNPLWSAKLHHAICHTQHRSLVWYASRYSLENPFLRSRSSARLQQELRRLPPANLEAECDRLCLMLNVPDPASDDPTFSLLSPELIARMQHTGMIEFGGHTRSHASLGRLPFHEQEIEIRGCAADLTELCGRTPRFFAYPYGTKSDFDRTTERLLAGAGFRAAFTTGEKRCPPKSPPMRLPRVSIGSHHWEQWVS
jgi:peptidoglycan/xylan/chitin deacetylase (PgdA/CDA1 family)